MRGNVLRVFAMMALVLVGLACTTQRSNVSYQDRVKSALEQADLKGVSVDEDTEKNTITRLAETSLPSMPSPRPGMWRGQRLPAGSSPMRLVFSPLAQSPKPKTSPPASTGRSRKTIEPHSSRPDLDKQHITFGAKNGVLTWRGSVSTTTQHPSAQEIARAVPNLQQALDEIGVKR